MTVQAVSSLNKAACICSILESVWAIPVCAFCGLHKMTGSITMAEIKANSLTMNRELFHFTNILNPLLFDSS